MGYFGTEEALPSLIELKAGNWSLAYEQGKLRYFKLGELEVLRMIYPAVRDQYWRTAPAHILSESITADVDSFQVEYTASYQLEEVDYQARYLFRGNAQGQISIEMWGEAQRDFWRNRIGLCVLHPLDTCAGQALTVLHPDGRQSATQFPMLISPHQPFLEVQGMNWNPYPGCAVQLRFIGEVFETEDQRNWTDSSYKTYGTPLSIPFPAQVKQGDQLYQKITLEYHADGAITPTTRKPVEIKELEAHYSFPQLGTDWTSQLVEDTPPLPLHFLNVLVDLEKPHWHETLQVATQCARKRGLKLGLSVNLSEAGQLAQLQDELLLAQDYIQHICILSNPVPSRSLMEEVYPHLKSLLPQCPLGYGTDGFFAELNRNRPATDAFDFMQFSLNPQVHAEDTRTVIENLAAQRDALLTAQDFAVGKALYVAPITLRWRYNPNPAASIDPRQHSELLAAWLLLSLKYLAPAKNLSYFEWVGTKGILPTSGTAPLLGYLEQIQQFQPVKIIDTHSSSPLQKDLLLLENAQGQRLGFEVDFDAEKIVVLH